MPLKEFIRLIETAHEGQMYKGGVPYKHHIHRVAFLTVFLLKKHKELSDESEIFKAAFAHDVLEDTKVSEQQLAEFCNEQTVAWINSLTSHQKNPPRPEYVQQLLSANEEVKLIKLVDLYDNMQTGARRINENGVEWTKKWFLPIIEEQFVALKPVVFSKFPETGREIKDWCDYSLEMLKEEIKRWE